MKDIRVTSSKSLAGPSTKFTGDKEKFIEAIRQVHGFSFTEFYIADPQLSCIGTHYYLFSHLTWFVLRRVLHRWQMPLAGKPHIFVLQSSLILLSTLSFQALYASKIISYAQGFMLLRQAAKEFKWELNYGGEFQLNCTALYCVTLYIVVKCTAITPVFGVTTSKI